MNNKSPKKTKKDKCQKCGHCCSKLIVEIGQLDVIREPRLLKGLITSKPLDSEDSINSEPLYSEDEPDELYGLKIPCPFLMEDNKCSIYPTRPNICVSFNFGSSQCKYDRSPGGLSCD